MQTFSRLSETFVYDQITELERQGEHNHVITLERDMAEERPFPRVSVLDVPGRWNLERLCHRALAEVGIGGRDQAQWPALRRQLRALLAELAPDVVHAQFGTMGALVASVAKGLGVPTVVTFHGFDITGLPRDPRWRRAYQRAFAGMSLALGVSGHICDRLRDLGAPPDRVRCHYLGTRLDRFHHRDPASVFDGRTVRCLHVGRLVEKKGPVQLVEAFAHAQALVPEGIDLRLSVVGDGPLRKDVEDAVNRMRVAEKVELLGACPHETVRTLFHRSHLYTQHSVTASNGDQEGLPVALMEAAAVGLPAISTRHSGIPDLVAHEQTGLLVAEHDVMGMAQAIARMARHPERWSAMAEAGRKRLEADFDLVRQTERLRQIYRELAVPRRPASEPRRWAGRVSSASPARRDQGWSGVS